MAWYTAECLYRSELDGAAHPEDLCEARYFLLQANDDASAREKARELAKKKQHSYFNQEKQNVNWIFEDLVDVKEVLADGLSEGTEVYHKYFSRSAERRRTAET